jgi:propanol-preferring alcohol dehydrogenase
MRAMLLKRMGEPLRLVERPDPEPDDGEVRVRVTACGVCRTDLHVVDGELPNPKLPIVPGHEIVGRIDAVGPGVDTLAAGMRVGDRKSVV